MLRRRLGRLLLSIAALATMSACADAVEAVETRAVIVRPRVVVDGTVELSDRTAGRVLLSGITAHADEARIATDDGGVVVDDRDPLFFSFSPTRPEDQQAAERTWTLPVVGGDLRVGFGPADEAAIAAAPFDAAMLAGHTVVIAGTIAITPSADADGFVADIDPDGTPADQIGEVDPDGTPADQVGEVDPDGTPADVDPDGTPAIGAGSDLRSEAIASSKGKRKRRTMQGNLVGRPEVRVPFTLTVDGAFEHRTSLSPEAIAAVDDGEVLPIDLRFQAAAFFDAERLAVLERLAGVAVEEGDADGAALQVSAATTANVVKVEARRAVRRLPEAATSSSKIVVTGPTGK